MKKRCAEYPNCCDKHHGGVYHEVTPDIDGFALAAMEIPGMGALEPKDRPSRPAQFPKQMKDARDRGRKRRYNNGAGDSAWAAKMRAMRCHYCGGPGGTVDHIIPLGQGGETKPDNCVPACAPCNNFRGQMDYVKFKKLGWLKRLENEA